MDASNFYNKAVRPEYKLFLFIFYLDFHFFFINNSDFNLLFIISRAIYLSWINELNLSIHEKNKVIIIN